MRVAKGWVIGSLVAVGLPGAAGAMQNEPSDFLGIEWGAPIERFRGDLKPIMEDGDIGHYRRVADRLYFAGVEVRRITYQFYKGGFASGMYLTVGSNDLKSILAHLTSWHGEPHSHHPRHRVYVWEGERSGVIVSCDISVTCYTEFYDKASRAEVMKAQEPRRKDD